jgi:hypothetical protein
MNHQAKRKGPLSACPPWREAALSFLLAKVAAQISSAFHSRSQRLEQHASRLWDFVELFSSLLSLDHVTLA